MDQNSNTNLEALKEMSKKWAENHKAQQPCPSCGHCPTCGRGGYYGRPYYPYYPSPYSWGSGGVSQDPDITYTVWNGTTTTSK